MFSWVRQVLALSAALLVAFAPGWCCFAPQRGSRVIASEPARRCCSGAPAAPHAPAQGQHPHQPSPESACFCKADVALPPGPEAPPAETAWAFLGTTPNIIPSLSSPWSAGDCTPFPISPQLQLLYCVWLC